MNANTSIVAVGIGAVSVATALVGASPASASETPSTAVHVATFEPVRDNCGDGTGTSPGSGPTLGVGGPESYTGGTSASANGGQATLGVGGPESYTGGSPAGPGGGTASKGVGGVNSYTGGSPGGCTHTGTNSTTRSQNYGDSAGG